MAPEMNRRLTVKLEGPLVQEGRVPVKILSRTLEALQRTLVDIGESLLTRQASRPGRKPERLERECELFVSKLETGSFVAGLELRKPRRSLFPELRGMAEDAFGRLETVVQAVEAGDVHMLASAIPDAQHRARVVRDVLAGAPAPEAEYAVSLRFSRGRPIRFARPSDEVIERLSGAAAARAASGVLEEAMVKARCLVRFNESGQLQIVRSMDVIEYTLFEQRDLCEFSPREVEFGGRRWTILSALKCDVNREDGLIIISCPELGVRAYAETRAEAEGRFAEELAFIMDEYASREDAELTADARELKRKLLRLVRENELETQEDAGHRGGVEV